LNYVFSFFIFLQWPLILNIAHTPFVIQSSPLRQWLWASHPRHYYIRPCRLALIILPYHLHCNSNISHPTQLICFFLTLILTNILSFSYMSLAFFSFFLYSMFHYFHFTFFSSSYNIFLKYLGFYQFRNYMFSTLTKLLFVWKVNTNQFKLVLWIFFIENIQFVYVIVYTLVIFNSGKIIMFQLFKMDPRIVVLVLKNFYVWHFLRTLQSDSLFLYFN